MSTEQALRDLAAEMHSDLRERHRLERVALLREAAGWLALTCAESDKHNAARSLLEREVAELRAELQRYRGLDKILTNAREIVARQAADPHLRPGNNDTWLDRHMHGALLALHDALRASA